MSANCAAALPFAQSGCAAWPLRASPALPRSWSPAVSPHTHPCPPRTRAPSAARASDPVSPPAARPRPCVRSPGENPSPPRVSSLPWIPPASPPPRFASHPHHTPRCTPHPDTPGTLQGLPCPSLRTQSGPRGLFLRGKPHGRCSELLTLPAAANSLMRERIVSRSGGVKAFSCSPLCHASAKTSSTTALRSARTLLRRRPVEQQVVLLLLPLFGSVLVGGVTYPNSHPGKQPLPKTCVAGRVAHNIDAA